MMTLLLHLQARGHCSGKDLARLLEVSERTVQRDVAASRWICAFFRFDTLPYGE